MTVEPFRPPRPMTRADLAHTPPHLRRACSLLLDHGIDPYEIPADHPDTFTEHGYLAATGADLTRDCIIVERRPYPPGLTLGQISDALDALDAP